MKKQTHRKKQSSKSDPTVYRTNDPTITITIPKPHTKDSPISAIGHFKSIDSEFTITATPEAWIKLHKECFGPSDTWAPYHYQRQGLFKDIKPFIRAAYLNTTEVPPETGKKNLRKILYIQAAIIHDLKKALSEEMFDEKMKEVDLLRKTLKIFKSVWREEIEYAKMKMPIAKTLDTLKTFRNQYINGGRKYFDGDKKILSFFVRSLRDYMDEMKKDNSSGYKGNEYFQMVYDMNFAVIATLEGVDERHFKESPMIRRFMALALKAFPSLK